MIIFRSIILFVHPTLPPEKVEFIAENREMLLRLEACEGSRRAKEGWKLDTYDGVRKCLSDELLSV